MSKRKYICAGTLNKGRNENRNIMCLVVYVGKLLQENCFASYYCFYMRSVKAIDASIAITKSSLCCKRNTNLKKQEIRKNEIVKE